MATTLRAASNLNHFVVPGLVISGFARLNGSATTRRRLSIVVYWNPIARKQAMGDLRGSLLTVTGVTSRFLR